MTSSISFQHVMGQSILIIGDVGAGKTQLTVRLVDEALAAGMREHITIIDMAPTTRFVGALKIGGQLQELAPHLQDVRYLAPSRIETPRLSARSSQELQHLITLNQQRITPLLHAFLHTPSPILVINDVSLYLQSGSLALVTQALGAADTCVVNGYYGQSIQTAIEDPVSRIERALMDRLRDSVDLVVSL